MSETILAGCLLATGVGLGFRRPILGLAIFLAGVSVVGSLDWQLGFTNLAIAHAYAYGLLVGLLLDRRASGRSGGFDSSLKPVLYGVCLLVGLGIVQTVLRHSREFPSELLGEILIFEPSGVAGILYAGAGLVVPPVIAFLISPLITQSTARTLISAAFIGFVVAVSAPVGQVVLGLPTRARPDLGFVAGREATGIIGFFQDPHEYAAYLTLMMPVMLSIVLSTWRARRPVAAGLYVCSCGIGLWAFFNTNSRSALVGMSLALLVWALLVAVNKRRAVLILGLGLVTCLWVAAVRQPAGDARESVEASAGTTARMWVWLSGDSGGLPALAARRIERWRYPVELSATFPLWGVGIDQLSDLSIPAEHDEDIPPDPENAHNYWVQLSAEQGLPLLAGYVALVLVTWTRPARVRAGAGPGSLLRSGILAGAVGILVVSFFAHPFLHMELHLLFWVLLVLGLRSQEE